MEICAHCGREVNFASRMEDEGVVFHMSCFSQQFSDEIGTEFSMDVGDVEDVEDVSVDSYQTEIHAKSVTIADFNMPFWSMVVFMVKWSIASIPAFLILLLITVVTLLTLTKFGLLN
tara:strand:- start:48 stop:398 length:351 start_codon:yes stop_codon:yes gene_type:complete